MHSANTFYRLLLFAAFPVFFAVIPTGGAQVTLVDRYSFNDGTANDSVGGRNGTLVGTATISNGVLNLPGSTSPDQNYLSLPIGDIITSSKSLTVEAWFTLNSYVSNSKLFCFGTNPSSNLDYVPSRSNSSSRVEIYNGNAAQGVAASTTLPSLGVEHQVVAVFGNFNPSTGVYEDDYYLDGTLQASMTQSDFSNQFASSTNNYVGAAYGSVKGNDLNGTVDELRIFTGAMSASQVSAEFSAGPNVVAVPEPSTSMLLLITGALLVGARRSPKLERKHRDFCASL